MRAPPLSFTLLLSMLFSFPGGAPPARAQPPVTPTAAQAAPVTPAPTAAQSVQTPAEARAAREVARGDVLLGRGQRAAAERAFSRALRHDPASVAALGGLAGALLGDMDGLAAWPDELTQRRAARVLAAVSDAPEWAQTEQLQLVIATALAAQGQHGQALALLARAPRLRTDTLVPALDALALLAAERRDLATCEGGLRLALELQPTSARAQRLADVLLARGSARRAVSVLHAAVGFDPDAMTLRRALAEAQLAAGDAAGAETTLARVVARCPWRCEALLARVALEAGDMTLAARRARDLLARPSAGRPHAVAGGLATGQPPVEEREREDALGERESRTAAGYVLGLALARLGEPAQARAALAEVLRREPTHRGARQALRALEPEPEPEG